MKNKDKKIPETLDEYKKQLLERNGKSEEISSEEIEEMEDKLGLSDDQKDAFADWLLTHGLQISDQEENEDLEEEAEDEELEEAEDDSDDEDEESDEDEEDSDEDASEASQAYSSGTRGVGDMDSMRLYINEIRKFPLLTPEEEKETARLVAEGTPEEKKAAREKMINSNLRLVVKIANQFRNNGVSQADLVQSGTIGLMRAVDKFDYKMGNRFSTYATPWITSFIRRAIEDHSSDIRIPVHQHEQISKVKKASRQLEQELGREPTSDEIAKATGLDRDKVEESMTLSVPPVSMESPAGEEGDSKLGDFVEDTSTVSPDEYASQEALKEELNKQLALLTPREQEILRMRYGLDNGQAMTLEEVGKKFGITRERVRQIEEGAKRKIKNKSRKELNDWYEG